MYNLIIIFVKILIIMKDLKSSVQIENVLLVHTNTHAGKYSGKKKKERKGKDDS